MRREPLGRERHERLHPAVHQVDGPDVVTWYELHTKIAPPAAVAEWSHVEQGKITMVRVVFDARPFTAAQPLAAAPLRRACSKR